MNVLFVCTSNKDRSPALEKFFEENYSMHNYRSAGVNRYHTKKKGTHYLTSQDINWADLIVYAEEIHRQIVTSKFKDAGLGRVATIALNLGEYTKGDINQDYLYKAYYKLKKFLMI